MHEKRCIRYEDPFLSESSAPANRQEKNVVICLEIDRRVRPHPPTVTTTFSRIHVPDLPSSRGPHSSPQHSHSTNITPTRTQKLRAFVVKLKDPTSSPYLFSILLDLFCSLMYCVCVSTQLSYASEVSLWLSGSWAFCALFYGVTGRRKWSLRSEALRRRRNERENIVAEGSSTQHGVERKKIVAIVDANEKREMIEV
jgi:hypothetical protein